jgi:hypothetical protein
MAKPLPVRTPRTDNADLVEELRRRTGMNMFGTSSILKPEPEQRRVLAVRAVDSEPEAPAPRFGM